jgi:chaperonin GroES
MKLEAIYNAVIVKPIEREEEQYGSIVVPDVGKEKNHNAVVVAVGPGQHTHQGVLVKTILKVGDEVIVPTMGFTKLEHQGEEYWVGPENQILAKLNK